jgi:hypothetical protein
VASSTLITAVLPLVGVALGAGLHHMFSRSAEERKQLSTLRTQAYVDYLRAVAKFAQAAKTDPAERSTLLAEAADAKSRICIYGSKDVVKLLADFERHGAALASKEAVNVFLSLCAHMRSEGVSSEESVVPEDLELVLFGPER